jgi:hypothetical protein
MKKRMDSPPVFPFPKNVKKYEKFNIFIKKLLSHAQRF